MTKQVCCIGELLIDMFSTDVDVSLKDAENFKRKAGGAPANVAATVANLGGKASMIGKVGNDAFGKFLIETLKQYKVDPELFMVSAQVHVFLKQSDFMAFRISKQAKCCE